MIIFDNLSLEGIFLNKAIIDGLTGSKFRIYLLIVRNSVGYGQSFTNRMTVSQWCKKYHINKNTWVKYTKELEKNGYIVRKEQSGFNKDGGSLPFAYGPVFPEKIHIWLKDKDIKDTTNTTNEFKEW